MCDNTSPFPINNKYCNIDVWYCGHNWCFYYWVVWLEYCTLIFRVSGNNQASFASWLTWCIFFYGWINTNGSYMLLYLVLLVSIIIIFCSSSYKGKLFKATSWFTFFYILANFSIFRIKKQPQNTALSKFSTPYLLVLSADNFFKQFGTLTLWWYSWNNFSKNLILKKISRRQKS